MKPPPQLDAPTTGCAVPPNRTLGPPRSRQFLEAGSAPVRAHGSPFRTKSGRVVREGCRECELSSLTHPRAARRYGPRLAPSRGSTGLAGRACFHTRHPGKNAYREDRQSPSVAPNTSPSFSPSVVYRRRVHPAQRRPSPSCTQFAAVPRANWNRHECVGGCSRVCVRAEPHIRAMQVSQHESGDPISFGGLNSASRGL